ncbi:MAG TPA: MCE family protein, partial [Pseudobdellovibrionaceae bacterium]|nr:MCE family protein [Pseudobdellovibrionaceae bacterium]
IRLQDGQARIDITIKSDVPLYRSASVAIKSQGILGDKYVEVNPGSVTDELLENGTQIGQVKDKGSLDNLVGEVSDITSSLKSVAEALKESVQDNGTRKHILGRIVSNIEKLTGDIAEMTSENKGKLGEIVDQVRDVSSVLSKIAKDDSDKGFKKSWEKIADAAKNLEEITAKVNRGDGTIGKLINDETTVDELNTTIEGINGMLDTGSRIQTAFDFRGDYLTEVGSSKTDVGIRIQPGLDRYYYLAIVSDPQGVVERSRTAVSGSSTADYSETKTYYSKTKITALFAKNFWDFTLKGGLIENAAGLGMDYTFMKRKMRFSLEAFDFAQANLRASVSYHLLSGFYVSGGMTDILNKSDRRSTFLGAGLLLTNDDLKLLLTKSPF